MRWMQITLSLMASSFPDNLINEDRAGMKWFPQVTTEAGTRLGYTLGRRHGSAPQHPPCQTLLPSSSDMISASLFAIEMVPSTDPPSTEYMGHYHSWRICRHPSICPLTRESCHTGSCLVPPPKSRRGAYMFCEALTLRRATLISCGELGVTKC